MAEEGLGLGGEVRMDLEGNWGLARGEAGLG